MFSVSSAGLVVFVVFFVTVTDNLNSVTNLKKALYVQKMHISLPILYAKSKYPKIA